MITKTLQTHQKKSLWIWIGTLYLLILIYQIFLGRSGYFERKEWEQELVSSKWDLDRVREENQILLQRKKQSLKEPSSIDKEAKKYYLLKEGMGILKFTDSTQIPDSHDLEKITFWNRLKESIRESQETRSLPPLPILRLLYWGISFFFLLSLFFHLMGKKGNDNNSYVNPIEMEKKETKEGL